MDHLNPSSEVAAGGLTCRKAVEDGAQAGRRPNPVPRGGCVKRNLSSSERLSAQEARSTRALPSAQVADKHAPHARTGEAALPLSSLLGVIWPVGRDAGFGARIFLCDESKNLRQANELGTGLRRGRAVNRALIWLIRANPTQIGHTSIGAPCISAPPAL